MYTCIFVITNNLLVIFYGKLYKLWIQIINSILVCRELWTVCFDYDILG